MYACVGAAGTAVQYVMLVVLVSTGAMEAVAASSLGAVIGAVVNYILNYHFTFRSSESHASAAPRYFLVAFAGFCANWAAMTVMAHMLGIHYILAQVISTCAVLALTFGINAAWSFKGGAEQTRHGRD